MIVSVFVRVRDLLKGRCLDAFPCWLYHKFRRKFLPRGGWIFYNRLDQRMRETMTEQSRHGPAPTWGLGLYKAEKDLGVSYPCDFVEQWYDKTFFCRASEKNKCFIVQQSYASYKCLGRMFQVDHEFAQATCDFYPWSSSTEQKGLALVGETLAFTFLPRFEVPFCICE